MRGAGEPKNGLSAPLSGIREQGIDMDEYEPITGELRRKMDTRGWYDEDGNIVYTTGGKPVSEMACLVINSKTFGDLCDAIDSVHAKLEGDYARLKAERDSMAAALDAAQGEHAYAPESHYMLLPRDADGVPIHEGDVMKHPACVNTAIVCGIGHNTFFTRDNHGEFYRHPASTYVHYHVPDTWERIIMDAVCGGDEDELVARCKALAGEK